MAKGTFHLSAFRKAYEKTDRKTVGIALHDAFIAAIHDENS